MGEPLSPKSPTDPPDEMISREQLRTKFEDYDKQDVYDKVLNLGKNRDARNFVVQFGGETAQVATDLDEHYFTTLMKQDNTKEEERPIRWINIWNPSQQRKIIDLIGAKYGFSTRLKLTIYAWDHMKQIIRDQSKPKPTGKPTPAPGNPAKFSANLSEAEKGATSTDGSQSSSHGLSPEEIEYRTQLVQPDNIAIFHLMQEQMNYTSIDQEKQFICIGANWLHKRPEREKEKTARRKRNSKLVPPYHFSWFALCGDNTVLSFHEAAHDFKVPKGEDSIRWQQEKLENTRTNTMKVLRQLSKIGLEKDKSNYMQLTSVRKPLMANVNQHGRTAVPEERAALEGSSNLFYYLFEDYTAAYSILQDSKTRLEELKANVLLMGQRKHHHNTDEQDVIPGIHKLHGELRQLKHLFTSYKTLITRILKDKHGLTKDTGSHDGDPESTREKLSTRARDRFERLLDRMESLMLDTIQEYLDEKSSLQKTYFNFLQQKDSEATARLTRSATLLAKLSVFFLPISFLTSFYSIQLEGFLDGETKEKYWTIFGVLVGISLLALFGFSRLLMFISDKLDGYTAVVEGKIMRGIGGIFPKIGEKKERKRAAELDEDD